MRTADELKLPVTITFGDLIEVLRHERGTLDPSDAEGLARSIRMTAERLDRAARGEQPDATGPDARHTRTVTVREEWGEVWLRGISPKPYRALVAQIMTVEGWSVVRFTRAAMAELVADMVRFNDRMGGMAATTMRLGDGDLVHVTSTPPGGEPEMCTVRPDTDGLYSLGEDWSFEPASTMPGYEPGL